MPTKRHGSARIVRKYTTRHLDESSRLGKQDVVPLQQFDVDEWDRSRGGFLAHAMAGSIAGAAEHSCMFPVDTVKTMMQTRGSALSPVVLMKSHGPIRLWFGVQTMLFGCIPAHAAYFSIYEALKPIFTTKLTSRNFADASASTAGAGAAVAVASVAHDIIMTPLDVCKQRLQLGYHSNSMMTCVTAIYQKEGIKAFFRSFPVTVAMNIPYAFLAGSSNEGLRHLLCGPNTEPGIGVFLVAGGGAGAIAAGVTNPLDVVKTRLQTQHFMGVAETGIVSGAAAEEGALAYRGFRDACSAIHRENGVRGFFRGLSARMATHAPALAISWTAYESAKRAFDFNPLALFQIS